MTGLRRGMTKVFVAAVLTMGAFSASAATTAPVVPAVTADQALKRLQEGNENFVKGKLTSLVRESQAGVRKTVAAGQKPFAVILACSDSRVPPEILFDQGLGEIFVVRVAGNVVSPHELGSIEYAAEHLGTPLVMVLGHERCGAVTATVDAPGAVEGNIGSLIESIRPAVDAALASHSVATHEELVEASADENVKLVAANLEGQSPVIKKMVEEGLLKIVGAKYDLDDGKVRMMSLK